jgi:two-component system cell cycle response regulator DivK
LRGLPAERKASVPPRGESNDRFFAGLLAHFQAKLSPLRVKRMRLNEHQEPRNGSIESNEALDCQVAPLAARVSRPDDHRGMNRRPMQKSVLIVEDNELNMKLFNDLLEAHGYRTVQTRSGVEAVELARTHKPNLILMDIQLPEVSGLQVTQWIKDDEDLRHIPVIAITAFAMKGDEEKIRQGGCEAYLSKPISVVKFLETVRNYISEL